MPLGKESGDESPHSKRSEVAAAEDPRGGGEHDRLKDERGAHDPAGRPAADIDIGIKLEACIADDDGAVVIPKDLVDFIATEGEEHERYETWVVSEVERGVKLPGLYPMNAETKARYEAQMARKPGDA